MSENHPIPHSKPLPPRQPMAPMGVEDIPGSREPARQATRSSAREYQRPEPHQKYELHPDEFPPGMDLNWLPITIAGAPNDKLGEFYREHWEPARAEDFPRLSGFGTEYPQSMIDRGLLKNVSADEPVIVDGQMLVMRSKEHTRKAEKRRNEDADSQVANQMQRLNQAYRNARGIGVKRNYGAMPAIAPQGDEE